MKAILVVDIPDDFDFGNSYSYIFTTADGKHQSWKRITNLRPMPQKDFEFEAEAYQTEEEYKAYVDGWNDCIDELLRGE